MKCLQKSDKYDSKYEEHPGLGVVMSIVSVLWIVVMLFSFAEIDLIIAGFLNPEYWALKEIIRSLK